MHVAYIKPCSPGPKSMLSLRVEEVPFFENLLPPALGSFLGTLIRVLSKIVQKITELCVG